MENREWPDHIKFNFLVWMLTKKNLFYRLDVVRTYSICHAYRKYQRRVLKLYCDTMLVDAFPELQGEIFKRQLKRSDGFAWSPASFKARRDFIYDFIRRFVPKGEWPDIVKYIFLTYCMKKSNIMRIRHDSEIHKLSKFYGLCNAHKEFTYKYVNMRDTFPELEKLIYKRTHKRVSVWAWPKHSFIRRWWACYRLRRRFK